MRLFLFAVLLFLIPISASAQDNISVDLATDHIDITTGFNGARLSLFGVREGTGEVAVVVRGPKRAMTVRERERILGAWMNRRWVTFDDVPVYYAYATSVPENELAAPEVLRANGIGLESLQFQSGSWAGKNQREEFRNALIRNRQTAGLIAPKGGLINPISNNFFRANFDLPPNVHPGNYQVQTYYFRNGEVRNVKTSKLRVAHVGTNANILNFTQDHAFTYGLLCISIAIFAGWFSNRIRRRS
jgi:uncharacterized protein (TIGR02186 family)